MPALTRRNVLALGAQGIAIPYLSIFSADAAPLAYALKPVKVADGIWTVFGVPEAITLQNGGAIANITILDSREGAIIIDTGPSRRYGEELVGIAKSLTGKDVARAYITHFHPDHAFGNQAIAPERVAAPQGVIDGLQQAGAAFSDAMYYIAQDWMRGTEVVLPTKVVSTGEEEIGDRRLHLFALAGHTSSDLVILDEATGTLVTGDLAFLDRAPTTPHANVATWLETLGKLEAMTFARVIPGHGPAESGKRALTQTRDWLEAVSEMVARSYEQGLDILEAARQPLPERFENIALARYEFERSAMHFYPKLEARKLPDVGKKSAR